MLRSLALFSVLLFTAQASGAQVVSPLGDRIGPTLEASERDYFGLFPTIFAPLPWSLAVEPSGSVLIQRGENTLREIPPEDAEQLARLIDTFEDYPSVSDNPSWSESPAFRIYIDAQKPVPGAGTSSVVRVETPTGSYSGFALYTTDSLLVMAPEVRARDAAMPGAYTVRRSDILGVSQQQPTSWQKWGPLVSLGIGTALGAAFSPDLDRRAGAGFGALVGLTAGTLTSQQSRIGQSAIPASSLDSLALFNRARPPELPEASGAIARATSQPTSRTARRTRQRRQRLFEWVSIGIHGAVGVTDSEGSPVMASDAQTLTSPQIFRSSILERNRDALEVPYRIDVSVRPVKWFRAGAFAGSFTSGDSVFNIRGKEQQLRSVGRVRPYAELILPLARSGDQRIEVFAGGGMQGYFIRSFHESSRAVDVGRPGSTRPVGASSVQQDVRDEGEAFFYTAGVELHSTRYSSLFIRHSWHPIPTLDVPAFRYPYARDRDLSLRVVEAHEIDFSYRELMIGARFHL